MSSGARRGLETYGTRKPSTIRVTTFHVLKLVEHFGPRRLDAIKPSDIKSWTAGLRVQGYSTSYIHRLHPRLFQVLDDASTTECWHGRRRRVGHRRG